MVHTTVNTGVDITDQWHTSSGGDKRDGSDNHYKDWINDMRVGFYEEADYGSDIDWSAVGSGVDVETTFPGTPSKGVIFRRKNTNANSGKVRDYTYDGNNWIAVEYDSVSDYFTEVARGNVSGATAIPKFGRNEDVDVGIEDIWSNGGEWEPFSSGEQTCNIVSTGGNDDGNPVGTGARTVQITGISGGAITTETITMNGTTNVVTSNAYTIIYRMEVLTVGTTGSNVGIISAKGTTDTTETISCIAATENQTRMAVVQVPTGAKGIMYNFYLTINAATPATTIVILELKEKKTGSNTPWVTKHVEVFNSDTTGHMHHEFDVTKAFAAGSYIKLSATVDKNNTDLSGGFDIIMIDD